MGHTGTEKKNPFVMTIGFDKNDPEHVEVAEFLNGLPRKKAQYIVEAVRCYRQVQQDGSFWREDWGEKNSKRDNFRENNRGDVYSREGNTGEPLDKEAIRQIVLQILAERTDDTERVAQKTIPQPATLEGKKFRQILRIQKWTQLQIPGQMRLQA